MEKRTSFTIGTVAKIYDIHPQTLRAYEREGLLTPTRTEGNTRNYREEDLRQLELILTLTRDLGVNLVGVEVILDMRKKMEQMHKDMDELVGYLHTRSVVDVEVVQGRRNEILAPVSRSGLMLVKDLKINVT